MSCVLKGESPTINGDGSISRDFTYIDNVLNANLLALFSSNKESVNQIYNVACGKSTTLLELYNMIKNIADSDIEPVFGHNRLGDIPYSLADISKIQKMLGYTVSLPMDVCLKKTFEWYKKEYSVASI